MSVTLRLRWNSAAWKSKRAQEDYLRAMEYVVDKDFKLGMCLSYVYLV
jgi:hypothetical protein